MTQPEHMIRYFKGNHPEIPIQLELSEILTSQFLMRFS